MIYESKFMRRMRLEGSTAKTDKKNSVSFVSDSPKEDSENKLIEKIIRSNLESLQNQVPFSISPSMDDGIGVLPVWRTILGQWLEQCQPGDEWLIPEDWKGEEQRWQKIADTRIRHRDPRFRVWRNVDGFLVCKLWLYD